MTSVTVDGPTARRVLEAGGEVRRTDDLDPGRQRQYAYAVRSGILYCVREDGDSAQSSVDLDCIASCPGWTGEVTRPPPTDGWSDAKYGETAYLQPRAVVEAHGREVSVTDGISGVVIAPYQRATVGLEGYVSIHGGHYRVHYETPSAAEPDLSTPVARMRALLATEGTGKALRHEYGTADWQEYRVADGVFERRSDLDPGWRTSAVPPLVSGHQWSIVDVEPDPKEMDLYELAKEAGIGVSVGDSARDVLIRIVEQKRKAERGD